MYRDVIDIMEQVGDKVDTIFLCNDGYVGHGINKNRSTDNSIL